MHVQVGVCIHELRRRDEGCRVEYESAIPLKWWSKSLLNSGRQYNRGNGDEYCLLKFRLDIRKKQNKPVLTGKAIQHQTGTQMGAEFPPLEVFKIQLKPWAVWSIPGESRSSMCQLDQGLPEVPSNQQSKFCIFMKLFFIYNTYV